MFRRTEAYMDLKLKYSHTYYRMLLDRYILRSIDSPTLAAAAISQSAAKIPPSRTSCTETTSFPVKCPLLPS